ncbi:MAG: radical SAM protein [Planctomycetota bacterium]|nr:radical SAM protein [Planctomycetota bacterium]
MSGKIGYEEARRLCEEMMKKCRMCPLECGARRTEGKRGACRVADKMVVSSAFLHYGEEPVLVGSTGSGTIFFSGCNLHCVYCQNYDISQSVRGEVVSEDELVRLILYLERCGAKNINFVSPTHFALPILCAIIKARERGLRVPVVWNSGGYDSVEVLKALEGWVEIYMPDAKYADEQTAERLSRVRNYPNVMKANLKEMQRQVGDLKVEGGIAVKGVLVRHLVLPNGLSGARQIIDFLADEVSPNTYLNLMAQYRPCYKARLFPELRDCIDIGEFRHLIEYAKSRGLRLAR